MLFLQDHMLQRVTHIILWELSGFSPWISAGVSPLLYAAEFVFERAGSCGCQEKVKKKLFPLGKP